MTPEEQLLALENLVASDGWKLVVEKFQPKIKKLHGYIFSLSAEDSISRERMCMWVGGLTEILQWPEERIEVLRQKLNESKN